MNQAEDSAQRNTGQHRFDHALMSDRSDRRADAAAWSAESSGGMVATAHYLATEAGAAMLSAGGNAVDAAAAASLALGVCEPAGSGLGGMTMMVVHDARNRRTFTMEGPCLAPRRATPEALTGGDRNRGHAAVAVPTNPAVLDHALRNYGTLDVGDVLAPAIRLAEEGYPLSALQHQLLCDYLSVVPQGSAAPIFVQSNGEPARPGEWIRQTVLAGTLRRLADAGFEDFYRGEIARLICEDMREKGGFIREDDLLEYSKPRESEPLVGGMRDLQIHTIGPPAGGLALIQMAQTFHFAAGDGFDPDSPEGVVLLAEIIRRARRDRKRHRLKIGTDSLADAAALLSVEHALAVAEELRQAAADKEKNPPSSPFGKGGGGGHDRGKGGDQEAGLGGPRNSSSGLENRGGMGLGETSHISVMDRWGNVVAMTQSIERSFGAAVASPKLGFLYNGFLRAFKIKNTRHPHYLRPGAVARSNAAPTILFRDGKPWAALGSTGSERLASSMFQVLIRLFRQTPFEAVHAPRLHCTPQRIVMLEAGRFSHQCIDGLAASGFAIERLEPYSFKVGGLQLVVRDGERFVGVADPRRDGAAAGP